MVDVGDGARTWIPLTEVHGMNEAMQFCLHAGCIVADLSTFRLLPLSFGVLHSCLCLWSVSFCVRFSLERRCDR